MRLAVCFYGETRDYDKCIPIWTNFITKHNPHIYFHTWERGPSENIFHRGLIAGSIEERLNFEALKDGVDEYSSSARNVLPQTFSILRSISLMSRQYDFVIRTRFDLRLDELDLIDFSTMDPSKFYVCDNHWHGSSAIFDDNIMISSQDNIRCHNGGLFQYACESIKEHRVIPSGEQLIYHYFEKNDLMKDLIRTPALNFTLARNIS